MSLTSGTGPFGSRRAGSFDVTVPDHVVYVEPHRRRVRGVLGGVVVVDSDRVLLVHETGRMPHYAFPAADVEVAATDEPHADGHVQVDWDAVDAWYEEDERVEVHPRNPYHRVDCLPTSRRVRVSADGTVLADSSRAVALYETSLPVRYYLPFADVCRDLLVPSDTVTECPYKGAATYWSASLGTGLVVDVAWEYRAQVRPEAQAVQGLISFYPDRVEVRVDGQLTG